FPDGSFVVTGSFSDSATFGPGEVNETTIVSSGTHNIFVAKYGAGGSLHWAKRAGSDDMDYGRDVCALSDGSCIVTGQVADDAVFGPGEDGETVVGRDRHGDIFLAKYATDGTLVWVKVVPNSDRTYPDEGRGLSAFADGSCVVTGMFTKPVVFGQGEENETTLTSDGTGDIFVAKYNSDGTLAWAVRAGGEQGEGGRAIAALSDGSCLAAGSFSETATFGDGDINATTLTATGEGDVFLAKYNADGTLAWATSAGGGLDDIAYGLGILSNGDCLITGAFRKTATFGEGNLNETELSILGDDGTERSVQSHIFLAKYDAHGGLVWAKAAGGSAKEDDAGMAVSVLADGSCYVTGNYYETAVFGRDEDNETCLAAVSYSPLAREADIFVAKYNTDGTLAWATSAGGIDGDWGGGVAALPDGTCIVTGAFQGETTFGYDGPNETELVSAGGGDVFVAKYGD
ncbi:hypothetical protein ACFL1X_14295, partial [Candidatus Hydrogenedentota bacterium]